MRFDKESILVRVYTALKRKYLCVCMSVNVHISCQMSMSPVPIMDDSELQLHQVGAWRFRPTSSHLPPLFSVCVFFTENAPTELLSLSLSLSLSVNTTIKTCTPIPCTTLSASTHSNVHTHAHTHTHTHLPPYSPIYPPRHSITHLTPPAPSRKFRSQPFISTTS